MGGEGGERLYCMHFEVKKDGVHVVPAPVLVESMASIQRVVYLLAKFARGEELGQRVSFSRALRESFALQCRVPEPGSFAMPFEIGHANPSAVRSRRSRRCGPFVPARDGGPWVVATWTEFRHWFLTNAFAAFWATPTGRRLRLRVVACRTGLKIMEARGFWTAGRARAALHSLVGHTVGKRRMREDTISGMLVGMDFDERSIRLTRPDGKSVTATYDEESERPLIEHRRGWVELTGEVLYDADGRAVSVAHARDFVAFDEDTIELRNVHLCQRPVSGIPAVTVHGQVRPTRRAVRPERGVRHLRFRHTRGPICTTSCRKLCACSGSSTGEESPDRLSPKARRLRIDLRKRVDGSLVAATYKRAAVGARTAAQGISSARKPQLFRLLHRGSGPRRLFRRRHRTGRAAPTFRTTSSGGWRGSASFVRRTFGISSSVPLSQVDYEALLMSDDEI